MGYYKTRQLALNRWVLIKGERVQANDLKGRIDGVAGGA